MYVYCWHDILFCLDIFLLVFWTLGGSDQIHMVVNRWQEVEDTGRGSTFSSHQTTDHRPRTGVHRSKSTGMYLFILFTAIKPRTSTAIIVRKSLCVCVITSVLPVHDGKDTFVGKKAKGTAKIASTLIVNVLWFYPFLFSCPDRVAIFITIIFQFDLTDYFDYSIGNVLFQVKNSPLGSTCIIVPFNSLSLNAERSV